MARRKENDMNEANEIRQPASVETECAKGHSDQRLVRRLVENHPQLSPRERHNINRALDAGEAYGYGNVISWLMTEWAVNLRDKWGMDEKTAIRATQMSPYPLPPNSSSNDSKP